MGELTEMVLSEEIIGCSLCEDLAFENYNEVNELKASIKWYLECEDYLFDLSFGIRKITENGEREADLIGNHAYEKLKELLT